MSRSLSVGASGNAKKVTQAFGGVAVLLFGVGGGLVFWLNGQVAAKQNLAANREAQVGSSEEVAKRLDTTRTAYEQTQGRIAHLEASVSEKSYVPTLLQQLQALATTTHLTVTTVHPGPISTPAPPPSPAKTAGTTADTAPKKKPVPPPYDTMSVDLGVVGTYADTVTFLYDLTRFPKILSVEGAQLHPGAATSGTGKTSGPQVTTDLKLTAFLFHDAPPAPAGPGVSATTVVPPTAAPTVAGAAGRAALGAVAATRAANGHGQAAVSTL